MELRSFDGKTLQELTANMLLISPDVARLRKHVMKYLSNHDCIGSSSIFSFKLTPPGFILQKDCPTHQFVDMLRERLNLSSQDMPKNAPKPPYMRMAPPGSIMSSLEQCSHWFVSSNFQGLCEEFVQLRDMNTLYRFMLTPASAHRKVNKKLPELWFLSHATPTWQVDYSDKDGKFSTVSLCIANHKTGNKMFHGGGAQLILNAENARYPSPGRAETYVKPIGTWSVLSLFENTNTNPRTPKTQVRTHSRPRTMFCSYPTILFRLSTVRGNITFFLNSLTQNTNTTSLSTVSLII